MFSNTIKSFIILNIYFLIAVNVLMIIAIYLSVGKDRLKEKKYEKAIHRLKPIVMGYIEDDNKISEVKKAKKNDFDSSVVIDIMVEYSELHDADISSKFEALDLDKFIIRKIQRRESIVHIRKLAFMRVKSSYNVFLKLADSDDMDIRYMSLFALSLIRLPRAEKKIVIKKMIESNIVDDRIIEILSKVIISFEGWLELLENEETVKGRRIFIKNLLLKNELKDEKNTDRLLKYLKDDSEVRIAAIQVLSHSGNEKYVDNLIEVYEIDEIWQVRVAVAKGLSNFKLDKTKDILLKMTKDKEWWVRYNAIKSIVARGYEGLFTLIDLSLEVEDKHVSDLAYYFLNSNKEVYDTVKNIEV